MGGQPARVDEESVRGEAGPGEATDYLDGITAQWGRERPDLDVWPMHVIGRIKRLTAMLDKTNGELWAEHGLDEGLFDVLAALRRSGPPYRLSPTELYNSLLITSGTMTHRLSRLATDGLIERLPNPDDGRGMLVQLTQRGRRTIDTAVEAFLDQGYETLGVLTEHDRAAVTRVLRLLLVSFGDTGVPETSDKHAAPPR